MYGISPGEKTNLEMDMPCCLDHLQTVASYKEAINKMDTAAHRALKMRLQDPQGYLTPMERRAYIRGDRNGNNNEKG